MSEKTTDPRLRQVLEAGRQGRGRHSPLFLWMREHQAALRADFDLNGARWVERVRAMAEAGLTDHLGKPPTIRTAQQTWYRVCRGKRVRPVQPPGPITPALTSPGVQPAAENPDQDGEPARPRFGPAKMRG